MEEENTSGQWKVGKRNIPKSEIVFFSQTIIIFSVIVACIFNLSRTDRKDENIWTTLLGSCLGYMLPNPSLKLRK